MEKLIKWQIWTSRVGIVVSSIYGILSVVMRDLRGVCLAGVTLAYAIYKLDKRTKERGDKSRNE